MKWVIFACPGQLRLNYLMDSRAYCIGPLFITFKLNILPVSKATHIQRIYVVALAQTIVPLKLLS